LEELGRLIAQERTDGETKQKAIEKELDNIRASIEKLELNVEIIPGGPETNPPISAAGSRARNPVLRTQTS